jgi:hypothetical protein
MATFDTLIARCSADNLSEVDELVAWVLFYRVFILGEQGEWEAAIVAYGELRDRLGDHITPTIRKIGAKALDDRGFTLEAVSHWENAIISIDEVLGNWPGSVDDNTPLICNLLSEALKPYGFIMKKDRDWEPAIATVAGLLDNFLPATCEIDTKGKDFFSYPYNE